MRSTLEQWIAIERGYCASFSFVLEEPDGQLSLKIAGPGGIRAALNEASPLRERVDRSAASEARCRSLEVAALGQVGGSSRDCVAGGL